MKQKQKSNARRKTNTKIACEYVSDLHFHTRICIDCRELIALQMRSDGSNADYFFSAIAFICGIRTVHILNMPFFGAACEQASI